MAIADLTVPAVDQAAANARLVSASAEERIAWAVETFPGTLVLSTSFGAQAAVMLSLAARVAPGLPVVFIDTGYLFPETYRFADELTAKLKIDLRVYRAADSPAGLEARHGRLWEQGLDGLTRYNRLVKIEPMQRALRELGARAWLAGLRRSQSASREALPFVSAQDGRCKIHPLADWSDRDIHRYLAKHGLPYHPLWHVGYVSIGDTHSTRPLTADLTPEQTRFHGLTRECGLHAALDGGGI